MAHTLSAKKRNRQNRYRNALNRWRKRRIHLAVKAFDSIVLHHGPADEAEQAYRKAAAMLDKVAGKGAIHKNKAARKKSRMAKRLNALKG